MQLRTHLKSEYFVKSLVKKYNRLGDLVFDHLAGSYTTVRVCMFLPEHLGSIVGEKETGDEEHSMVQFVKLFASQILNNNSDISGTPDICRPHGCSLKWSKVQHEEIQKRMVHS